MSKSTSESHTNIDPWEVQLPPHCEDPQKLFKSLLGKNVSIEVFFKHIWERQPLHVKRRNTKYYGNILSLSKVMRYVGENKIRPQSNLKICRYKDGIRKDKTIKKRSVAGMKRLLARGYTAQIFSPQHFCTSVAVLCGQLEQLLSSNVGSSLYVTPPRSQGLAPHHDDVDVFVLQLQGKKRWRLYAPQTRWPKTYSRDMRDSEIGKPLLDVSLEAGDLLYLPRGMIHQACTGSSFSVHLTVSSHQNQAWDDLLLAALPYAMRAMTQEEEELRRSIPLDAMRVLGRAHGISNRTSERRDALMEKARNLTHMLADRMVSAVDKAADLMAADFVCGRMPRKFANVPLRAHHGKGTRILERHRISVSKGKGEVKKGETASKCREASPNISFNKTYWLTSSLLVEDLSRQRLIVEDECDELGEQQSEGAAVRKRVSIMSDLRNQRKYHMRASKNVRNRTLLPGCLTVFTGRSSQHFSSLQVHIGIGSDSTKEVQVNQLRLSCDEEKVILANILVRTQFFISSKQHACPSDEIKQVAEKFATLVH
eukprot:768097-Hanusia_phi.AAC.1